MFFSHLAGSLHEADQVLDEVRPACGEVDFADDRQGLRKLSGK